ncbi:hypothetical protein CERSUDRAFT_125208 [Gelatoporia subvermispora B]|uniref:VIT domain-containing protein n=1 Tax=Ceriporiopsis subvermispora (strain B) TaxID=914234 RepID=M2R7F1_CERS8|nr:hypothetical protein CERSUDRAFT_125208 [Gelatoporia subvermispora B]
MGKPFGFGGVASDGKLLFLPLSSVSVDASIFDVSALVIITQKYRNSSANGQLTTARYLFPIPEGASICAFKIELSNGSSVSGVVQETETAKKVYQDAVDQGEWAGLAYEITADVFAISVGSIPVGQDATVKITFATVVPDDESALMNQIRFALPTYIGERYGAAPAEVSQERSSDKAAMLSFRATIFLTSKVVGVTSPSHDIIVGTSKKIQSKPAPLYSTTVQLRDPTPFDQDLVLSIQAEKLDAPRCVAEVDEIAKTVAVSLTLVPRFGAPDVDSQEYVFLIDRSGSMDWEYRIDYAKDALQHLIKGLPSDNTYFNIVSFGSSHSSFATTSVKYDRQSVSNASKHIDSMTADMGGTEIEDALSFVFSQRMRTIPTAVIVLTDGDVWHAENVITTVRNAVSGAPSTAFVRVFSLGIGSGASTALCEGIARTGRGICYMTTKSEEIKDRCSKLLRAARAQPYGSASGLKIDWGYDTVARAEKAKAPVTTKPKPKKVNLFDSGYDPLSSGADTGLKFVLPPPPDVLQAPTQVPNLYPGNRFLVSAILSNTTEVPEEVTLSGTLPDGTEIEVPPFKVAYVVARTDERPPLLHTLAAHRVIRTLEDGDITSLGLSDEGDSDLHDEIVKAAVVQYGVRFSLATRFTSFVAVQKKDDDNEEDDDDDSEDSDDDDDDDDEDIDADEDDRMANNLLSLSVRGPAQRAKGRTRAPAASSRAMMSFGGSAGPHAPKSDKPSTTSNAGNSKSAPAASGSSKSPSGDSQPVLIAGSDLITAVARLQEYNGSFALDDALLSLLQRRNSSLTLRRLQESIPASLRELASSASSRGGHTPSAADVERLWAAALAAAYMLVALRDSRAIWEPLWDKAQAYVCAETRCASFMFNQLVQKAREVLQ